MTKFLDGRLVEWLTALGTIAAAVAAAWLGVRQGRISLSITADLARHGAAGRIYGSPDALVVDIANRGLRTAVVTGAYWRIGRFGGDVLPVYVPGPNPWPKRVDAGEGTEFAIDLNDIHRTVVPALRQRPGHVSLVARLATGKELNCRLSRDTRRWLAGSSVKGKPTLDS